LTTNKTQLLHLVIKRKTWYPIEKSTNLKSLISSFICKNYIYSDNKLLHGLMQQNWHRTNGIRS